MTRCIPIIPVERIRVGPNTQAPTALVVETPGVGMTLIIEVPAVTITSITPNFRAPLVCFISSGIFSLAINLRLLRMRLPLSGPSRHSSASELRLSAIVLHRCAFVSVILDSFSKSLSIGGCRINGTYGVVSINSAWDGKGLRLTSTLFPKGLPEKDLAEYVSTLGL